MKIHDSDAERNGWISVDKEKPPIKQWVKVSVVHMHDWNLESILWEGLARWSGSYWVKKDAPETPENKRLTKETAFKYQITHWKL